MEKIYNPKPILTIYYWICISIPLGVYLQANLSSIWIDNNAVNNNWSFGAQIIIHLLYAVIFGLCSYLIAFGITQWHKKTKRKVLQKMLFVNLSALLAFAIYFFIFKSESGF